jgi:hypothetical protein
MNQPSSTTHPSTTVGRVCAGGDSLRRDPASTASSRRGYTATFASLGPRILPVPVAAAAGITCPSYRASAECNLRPAYWGAESRGWILVPHYLSLGIRPSLSRRGRRRLEDVRSAPGTRGCGAGRADAPATTPAERQPPAYGVHEAHLKVRSEATHALGQRDQGEVR